MLFCFWVHPSIADVCATPSFLSPSVLSVSRGCYCPGGCSCWAPHAIRATRVGKNRSEGYRARVHIAPGGMYRCQGERRWGKRREEARQAWTIQRSGIYEVLYLLDRTHVGKDTVSIRRCRLRLTTSISALERVRWAMTSIRDLPGLAYLAKLPCHAK